MTESEDVAEAKPPTLRDVAAVANVSVATVSKVLTGGYKLRPETELRVREAVSALHFSPNHHAQSLHNKRTGTVGLLTSDLEGRFSIPVLMGAEDAFGTGDVSVFLCDARGDAIREQHHVRALLSRRVEGLIVVGHSTNPRASLGRLPVPVVYAYAPSSDPLDISIVSDNYGAGRLAAEHLATNGRRRIGYVAGDPTFQASSDRVAGAVDLLDSHGLSLVGGKALYGNWSEEWGAHGVRALLAAEPELDGVLCGNDVIARGAIDALRDLDKRVPYPVAVVGHDNWEIVATQARPPLTTVDMNLQELGRRAAQLLFAAIDGSRPDGLQKVDTRLIYRGSTAPVY